MWYNMHSPIHTHIANISIYVHIIKYTDVNMLLCFQTLFVLMNGFQECLRNYIRKVHFNIHFQTMHTTHIL